MSLVLLLQLQVLAAVITYSMPPLVLVLRMLLEMHDLVLCSAISPASVQCYRTVRASLQCYAGSDDCLCSTQTVLIHSQFWPAAHQFAIALALPAQSPRLFVSSGHLITHARLA